MANTVRLKRSAVQGKAPVVGDLSLGELAVNTYDGKLYMKKERWLDAIVEIGAGGSITVDSSAPSSPSTGDLWYDTESARTFVWTGTEWADAAPDSGYATATTGDSAPANANNGDLWYRTSDNRMYVYYDDGDSQQWVDANPNLPIDAGSWQRSGTDVTLANSGDNVGIGTSSPLQRLVVSEGGAQGLEINPFTEARVVLVGFNRATSLYTQLEYEGNGHVFKTGTDEKFRITDEGDAYLSSSTNTVEEKNKVSWRIEDGSEGAYISADRTAVANAPHDLVFAARNDVGSVEERMRINSNGRVSFAEGILFGTDTAAANTLDDFEQGTWTPTISTGVTSPVLTTSAGNYTQK